jgi:hypothetical protein
MRQICCSGLGLLLVMAAGCSSTKPLFNGKNLSGWVEVGSEGAWTVKEDGVLHCSSERTGYAWLSTEDKYSDFMLTLEWRVTPDANSGVFLRAPAREGRISIDGIEVQIKDDRNDKTFEDVSGSVFRRIPASGKYAKPIGQWNKYEITLKGRQLRIELNGHLVSDTNIDDVPPQGNDKPLADIPCKGYIGLQNHGDGHPVEYRNIRIKEL